MKPLIEERKIADKREYVIGILALLFSIGFAWILVPKIVNFINPTVDISQVKNLFNAGSAGYVIPEPIERTMFVTSIVLLPILLLSFIFLFNYIIEKIMNLPALKYFHDVLLIVFLSLIAYLVWLTNRENGFVYFANGIGIGIGTIFFVAVISFLMNLLVLNAQKNNTADGFFKIISFLANSICWIAIVTVTLLSVYSVGLVTDAGTQTYTDDFNAVFHPLVQVFLGKQILYNLSSQYGLFPHILEPVWNIIGLSVFKFTLLMSLLMGLSLFLLYKLFKELIDNKIIGYLGFLSIIWATYMWHKVIFMYRWPPSFNSFAFQFWPLRILFPVISMFITCYYFKTSSKKLYYTSFILYSISILWNFDTGVVVYFTWLITLIYEGLCDRDLKKILFHIMNWVLFLLLTFGLFTLFMYLRYGHLPVYSELFSFQKIYYVYGFFMLPMPLIHPWNLVIIIYLIGIAISLINLLSGNKSLRVFVIFNLSILGTGLFSYFQGRSHDFTLPGSVYPAVLIITIFADWLIIKIRDRSSVIINFIALNYITFFMIYCSITFVKNYKIIFATINERAKISFSGESTPVIRSAEFIKNNTKRGEEILLLSNLSGIYCLESRTTSPIKIIVNHIVLNSQTNDLLSYLNSNLCQKVFLDMNYKEETIWNFVQTNFKLSLVSPDRNIGVYIK